jgi:hypothetical protein
MINRVGQQKKEEGGTGQDKHLREITRKENGKKQ